MRYYIVFILYVHIAYTWCRERVKYVKINPDKLVSKPIIDNKWSM